MQNYTRLYEYIHEYQSLVYDYYSKHSVAFLTTYYNIDVENTIWDDELINGGYYERIGPLTGVRYNKYLLLPVYWPDEYTTSFDGQEIGQVKENELTITIPSSYGLTPYANDIVKLEQSYLRPTNDIYPIYRVSGIEIHPNTDRRFWKLKLEIQNSNTLDHVELQTTSTYTFFDYDKKIHTINDSISLTRLLAKNEQLRNRLKSMWNSNAGFYFF